MFFWIKDVLNMVIYEKKEIEDFINKYVICNKDGVDSLFVNY